MTVRDHLTSKKRRTSMASYLGMLGFVVGAILGAGNRVLFVLGLLSFAVAFLSVGYLVIGIRCPVCRNRLGQLLASVGGPFSISASLRCCPYCAVDFDSEMPREPANAAAPGR